MNTMLKIKYEYFYKRRPIDKSIILTVCQGILTMCFCAQSESMCTGAAVSIVHLSFFCNMKQA